MALNAVRKVVQSSSRSSVVGALSTRFYSLYEPDYLETGKSKIHLHDTLNIQIKGYNFPILEKYQQYIHNMATNIGVEVETCWALPPHQFKIQKFKPQSTVVDAEYKFYEYERNVQIVDVPATIYPILLRMLDASLPEGVSLLVHEHNDEHEELRYVPDKQLIELKTQLDDLGGPMVGKKRK